jgi:CubicO group peptidase (beta-lactamase class C family)
MIDRRVIFKLLAASAVTTALPRPAYPLTGVRELDANLEKALKAGHAPGLVGLVARGGDVHITVLGRMALGGPPMQRDSIFRLASMASAITAATFMTLVDDGKLKLDEPVDRLLPELADRRVLRSLDGEVDDTVPTKRPITVEDLLSNRCGWGLILEPPGTYPIQETIAGLGIVGFGPPDPLMPFDSDEWLRRLATLPLFAQPGERFLYETSTYIQGVLIERVEGKSLGEVMAERIFDLLGMKDTGFFVPPDKLDRLVTAYRPTKDGGLEVSDDPQTGGWSRPPKFEPGDSGLVSTADDYLAFARMLLAGGASGGRQVLSPESVKAMTTNHLSLEQRKDGEMILGEGYGWGYGMSVAVEETPSGSPEGSFGWIGGYGSKWESDPGRDLTTILFTQREFDSPKPAPIFEAFEQGARKLAE